MIHQTAELASKELLINPYSFFLDIYYYMDESANWLQAFQSYQKEAGAAAHKHCKHVQQDCYLWAK